MPEIVLHHYPMSPFSEKVRKVFAVKRLAWRGVEQPMWNPKPKLTPLTGGYRRIPVAGEIVALTSGDVAIRRRDPEVGEVVVHFPRVGFRIAPA